MTTAIATCAGCRNPGPIAELLDYAHGMGVVLRCPTCDTPVLRIVRTAGFFRLDLSGILRGRILSEALLTKAKVTLALCGGTLAFVGFFARGMTGKANKSQGRGG